MISSYLHKRESGEQKVIIGEKLPGNSPIAQYQIAVVGSSHRNRV